ncbi:MAG: HigA family addiction module antitoxin [Collinsella sp.]
MSWLRVTPGELLKEEFLEPLGISQYRLSKETGIPAQRIGQIVFGRRRVTADTDLRLCRYFGLTEGYWLRAQIAYDIEVARFELEPELEKIHPFEHDMPLRCREFSPWEIRCLPSPTIIDRTGKDSIAADVASAIAGGSLGPTDAVVREGFDPIPMWVADMSFATAPCGLRALRERIDHPCFGYFEAPQRYYDAVIAWHERRNGVHGMRPETHRL